MSEFQAIYLDSNPLLEGGWPHANTRLSNALWLAGNLGVPVFLLTPVEEELEAHRLRNLDDAIEKNKVSKALSLMGVEYNASIPARSAVVEAYRRSVDAVMGAHHIQRAPLTTRGVAELYRMAVNQQRPFLEGGRGFQDVVIALSAIDHAVSMKVSCAFVSKDGGFAQESLNALATGTGIEVIHFRDLEALEERLSKELSERLKRVWDTMNAAAVAAVRNETGAVEAFLTRELEVPEEQSGFSGSQKIREVKKISVLRVASAQTPIKFDLREDEPFSFTTDVLVGINAVVEGFSYSNPLLLLSPTRKLKAGAGPAPPATPPSLFESYGIREKQLPMIVEMEFRAERKQGQIVSIEPVSAKLK